MKKTILFIFLATLSFNIYAINPQKIKVTVGLPPIAFLVQEIGKEHVEVVSLLGPGQNAHTFEPSPKQIQNIADSKIYFHLNFPFEKVLAEKISKAYSSVINIALSQREEHHGKSEESKHKECPMYKAHHDPHQWMSVDENIKMMTIIKDHLIKIRPDLASAFNNNAKELTDKFDRLNNELTQKFAPFAGRNIYVYHPGFAPLLVPFGLNQISIELEGKNPTPQHLKNIIDSAMKERVKVIFVQPQFDKKYAQTLATKINGTVITVDALAYDLLENLRSITNLMIEGLSK